LKSSADLDSRVQTNALIEGEWVIGEAGGKQLVTVRASF
jgi:hypothetical protein